MEDMTKPKILLIEDETDLGNVVRQYLEISDFEVDWLTNGRLAYDRLVRDPVHYHLALIDVAMPEMDGFQLADKIVQLGMKLPFLFLTARNENRTGSGALNWERMIISANLLMSTNWCSVSGTSSKGMPA
jgi:DNA-binding response OmpR family regulator